jgi:phenylalanine-4-hydroxylase
MKSYTFKPATDHVMDTPLSHEEDIDMVLEIHRKQVLKYIDRAHPIITENLAGMDEVLPNGWETADVVGKIGLEEFFGLLSQKKFPRNVQVRHIDAMDYCPLRDRCHDRMHLIPLMNEEFQEIMEEIGELGIRFIKTGDNAKVDALSNFYWASIEFGMLQDEDGEFKPFGAGILSSGEEFDISLTNAKETRRTFDIREIIKWEIDPNGIQDRHYCFDSLDEIWYGLFYIRYFYKGT